MCKSTDLGVVPVHVQHVVAQHRGALVDVVDGQHDGGHDAATHAALRDVASVGEEARDVDVATPAAAEVRLLARRRRHEQQQRDPRQHHASSDGWRPAHYCEKTIVLRTAPEFSNYKIYNILG